MENDADNFSIQFQKKIINLQCYLKRWLLTLAREINVGELKYRAMALVYTTLLSLVPLLAVSFSVLKAFGVQNNQLKPFLLEMLTPLGEKGDELGSNIVGFVQNIQVGVLGSIGIVMLIYSVVSLLEIIKDSFNHVWRCGESRTWLRRVSDYLSILMIGPVLVFSALGVMASMENHHWVQKLIAQEPLGSLYYLIGLSIPYLLIISAFTFVYTFMPSCKVNFKSALVGGIVGGLGWKAVGWAFGKFIAESASYNAIYSSFAIIILFMFWLYVSWLAVLLGGAIAFYHQHPSYLKFHGQRPELSHHEEETLGLLLMAMIGRAYYEGSPPWTSKALAGKMDLPEDNILMILRNLEFKGLLSSLHTEPESFLPSRALETLDLQKIYQALRYPGTENNLLNRELTKSYKIFDLSEKMDRTTDSVLNGLTLLDLVTGDFLKSTQEQEVR